MVMYILDICTHQLISQILTINLVAEASISYVERFHIILSVRRGTCANFCPILFIKMR